jgi:hypothetical protein
MKYTFVKQYSIKSIDNIFNFFYKVSDFCKLLLELLWAFYEIWETFFSIFYNFFRYVYFLFLYLIDRSTESRISVFQRKLDIKPAYKPSSAFNPNVRNPIPPQYGAEVGSSIASGLRSVMSPARRASLEKSSSRRSALRVLLSVLVRVSTGGRVLFVALASLMVRPILWLASLPRVLWIRSASRTQAVTPSLSLIEQFMKEYKDKHSR